MHKSLVFLASFALAACAEQERPAYVTMPPAAENASVAYLAVSTDRPTAGSTVTISIRLNRGAGAEAIGSFTGMVILPRGVSFVAEQEGGSAMQAVRVSTDTVFIAGVSPTGYTEESLFAFDVRVDAPENLPTARLEITQATTVSFATAATMQGTQRGVVVK